MHHQTAYGLRLCSNQPLPGLTVVTREAAADLTIDFAGRRASGVDVSASVALARTETETLWDLGRQGCLLRYTDPDSDNLIDIHSSRADARIRVTWTSDVHAGYMPLLVLEPVLKAALHLCDVPCLHASAVSTHGRAVVFLGPSGAGKSTLAAAFAHQGHTLLSEEVAALDRRGGPDGVWVQPGYPRLRLTAASADALGWAADARPSPWMSLTADGKTDFDLSDPSGPFGSQPAKLAALYVLGPRRSGRHSLVTPLPPRQALPHLVENVYTARWQDAVRRAAQFRFFARLAETVPVYQLRPPDNLADLVPSLPSVLEPIREEASSTRPS